VDGKLVISTIRAKEAVEALLRFLMLKATPEEFAPAVKAVINQRLVRKLCNACKEAYQPPAAQIKQLGLPPTETISVVSPTFSSKPPMLNFPTYTPIEPVTVRGSATT